MNANTLFRLIVCSYLIFYGSNGLAQPAELNFYQRFVTPGDTLKVKIILPDSQTIESSVIGADTLIMTRLDRLSEGFNRWDYPLKGLVPGNYTLLFQGSGIHNQWPFTVVANEP